MQNDTCDDNWLANVTSTNSVNLHTEEQSEVPISSSFFYKNNALSPSSSTLLRARDKITLDTQEINCTRTSDHLL